MATFANDNFTSFSNVRARGTLTRGGQILFVAGAGNAFGSTGAWDSTVSVQNFSGATSGASNGSTTNEAPYLHIANVGLNVGTGFIRLVTGSQAGTLSVGTATNDQDKAWSFPNKSGTMPISGTFLVQLPAVAATSFTFSTVATVSGIRAEDGLTITRTDQGITAGYQTATTAKIFYSAIPANGSITMNFINLGAATGYTEHAFSYTAVR